MAISVDTVYKTVLLILNKEQRGFMTPNEFNKIASLVQLDILNEYFEDLNQQLRVSENTSEYANRIKSAEEKLDVFKKSSACTYSAPNFILPTDLYKLGSVIYNDTVEAERKNRNEMFLLTLAQFSRPTTKYPVYILESNLLTVYPVSIVTNINVTYIRKPLDPVWNFTSSTTGYTYTPTGSQDFELSAVEQTNVIKRILIYAGVVVSDPNIIQVAAGQVQSETVNKKS